MVEPIGSIQNTSNISSSGSRLLLQMGVAVYSVVAALMIIRCLYLSLGINDGLWVSSSIYGVTDPLVYLFSLLPGGDLQLIGSLTLADLSLLAIIVAVPFVLLARRSNE